MSGWRKISITTTTASVTLPWISPAIRSTCPDPSPTSSCSAIVRESSCSIGRNNVAATMKFTDQSTTIVP